MFLRRLVALLLVLLPVTGVRGAGDTCASSSHIFPYHPCYPQPIAARLKTGERGACFATQRVLLALGSVDELSIWNQVVIAGLAGV